MRGLQFQQVPGLAHDVSISPDGTPWVIGTNPRGRGNFGILYWDGRNWADTGGGGLRIAGGPQGTACTCNAAGNIHLWERGAWSPPMPGGAIDVTIGPKGQICILGNEPVSQQGDYGLWHWSGQQWTSLGGGGVRLTMAADGAIWVVNSNGEVWVYARQTWNGPLPGLGIDIGAGADGTIWLIGTNQVSPTGDRGLFRWNGQDWAPTGGGGTNVAGAPDGRPWITNANGEIYTGR